MGKKWYWGIFFLFAAAFVIINPLGYLSNANIGLPSLLLTVLLVPILIESLIHLQFVGIWFPVAFLLIIYDEVLGLTAITPWPVLIAALFLSIACTIMFKKNSWHHSSCFGSGHKFRESMERFEDSEFDCNVSFSEQSKYLHSASLKRANITCSFGSLNVFFDGAELHPDGASIYLDCSFGAIELYVPKTWNVINNVSAVLGAVDEKNTRRESDGPTLTLTGNVRFGGIEIMYV